MQHGAPSSPGGPSSLRHMLSRDGREDKEDQLSHRSAGGAAAALGRLSMGSKGYVGNIPLRNSQRQGAQEPNPSKRKSSVSVLFSTAKVLGLQQPKPSAVGVLPERQSRRQGLLAQQSITNNITLGTGMVQFNSHCTHKPFDIICCQTLLLTSSHLSHHPLVTV